MNKKGKLFSRIGIVPGLFLVGIFFSIVIAVAIGNKNQSPDIEPENNCRNSRRSIECWNNLLLTVFERKGLVAAFDLLSHLIESEPTVNLNCHAYVHNLGEATYNLFAKKKNITLSPRTSLCSYGFYHGFGEKIVLETGDPDKAAEFCTLVDKQLKGELWNEPVQSCYHGIGHGAATPHDPRIWGNEEKMIENGLKLCRVVSNTQTNFNECAAGVFNGIATFYTTQEYKLTIKRHDPLRVCETQSAEYRRLCYSGMVPVLMWLADNDIPQAARFLEMIDTRYEATETMRALSLFAGPLANTDLKDEKYEKPIRICRSLKEIFRIPCFLGFAIRTHEFGGKGEGYLRTLEFCTSGLLKEEEQEACHEYVLKTFLRNLYPPEVYGKICEKVLEKYKHFCR